MGARGVRFAGAVAALLVVSCGGGLATASPSDPQQVTASAPRPPASPLPSSVVYASAAFAYRLSMPAPWRRSGCQSAVFDEPSVIAIEHFTRVPEYDESASDVGPNEAGFVRVAIEQQRGLTPSQWLERGGLGQTAGQVISPITVDGRPAARLTNGALYPRADVVADRGRIYAIAYGLRDAGDASLRADLDAIVASFGFLTGAEVRAIPTPASPAPRPAEQVVDALADALERSDIDALRPLAGPSCVGIGIMNAGANSQSVAKFLDGLSAKAPLHVSVQRRPILSYDPAGRSLYVRSVWPGEPPGGRAIDLMLHAVGQTWYWSGNLIRQEIPSPRPP